jgi:hypothetical protein
VSTIVISTVPLQLSASSIIIFTSPTGTSEILCNPAISAGAVPVPLYLE